MQAFKVGKGTPYTKATVLKRVVAAFKQMGITAIPFLTPEAWGVEVHDTLGYHPKMLTREVIYLFQGAPIGFILKAPKSAEHFPLD